MQSAKYIESIIKADAIKLYIIAKVEVTKKDLSNLLKHTCITIALLLNNWIAINKVIIIAVNSI